MIVTCPACTSRYKFDDARLDGRSAKITCPTCDHVFVVDAPRIDPVTLKDTWPSAAGGNAEAPVVLTTDMDSAMDIRTVDLHAHGVTLRVRQGLLVREYYTLDEVLEALDEGTIDSADEWSPDGRNWQRVEGESELTEAVEELYRRIQAGEVVAQQATQSLVIGDDDGDEDAPTMIVRSSNLNLDEALDEDELPPPPPAAPAFQSEGSSGSEDPETETSPASQPSSSTTSAIAATATNKPSTDAASSSGRSVAPIVLLVLVVIAVVGLILYTQGLLPGVGV